MGLHGSLLKYRASWSGPGIGPLGPVSDLGQRQDPGPNTSPAAEAAGAPTGGLGPLCVTAPRARAGQGASGG